MDFPPRQFGKYQLTRRIAVGGMAEIYEAKLVGVDGFEKRMVVKQILPQHARDRAFIRLFIDEAKLTVTLSHGNIVPVYELGRVGETYFIAMEYVAGRNLAQVLQQARAADQPLSIEHAVLIAIEICQGLAYAHRRQDEHGRRLGLVHRDISPPNILISFAGEVKITDFGIAKAAHKLSHTEAGVVKGTYGYMSPEQVQGLAVDQRTDIFSTGVLLHEMLTGRRLFSGSTNLEAMERVKRARVAAPSSVNPAVPGALDPLVLKALARDPGDRYVSTTDLQLELSRFLFTSSTGATSTTLAEYMQALFDPQEQAPPPQQIEILASVDQRPGSTDRPLRGDATQSYAVREDFARATQMGMPALNLPLAGDGEPAASGAPSALPAAPPRAAQTAAARQPHAARPATPPTRDRTLALSSLPDLSIEESGGRFDEDDPTQVFRAARDVPQRPEVPALRFAQPGAADAQGDDDSLPAHPVAGSPPDALDALEDPTEADELPSADELTSLLSNLDEDTAQPAPGRASPAPAARPTQPAAPRSPAAHAEAADRPAPPLAAAVPRQPAAAAEPALQPAAAAEVLPRAQARGAPSPPAREPTNAPTAPTRPAARRGSRISSALSGTFRLFVEGLADEPIREADEPIGETDEQAPRDTTGEPTATTPPRARRSLRPTLLGWLLIALVMLGGGGYVLYRETDLLRGGAGSGPDDQLLNPADVLPEEAKPSAKGEIRIEAKPAAAAVFLYAGETPVQLTLSRGQAHVIRVDRDGFRSVYRTLSPVELDAKQVAITVTLEPVGSANREPIPDPPAGSAAATATSTVTIQSEPPKAMVWQLVGKGSAVLSQVAIDNSRYFKVLLPGHRPGFVRVSAVDFGESERFHTTVTLEAEADGSVANIPDGAPATPDATPNAAPAAKAPRVHRRGPRRNPRRRPRPRPHQPAKRKIAVPSWAK